MKHKRISHGLVQKEDVIQLIQNYIRNIQSNDYGTAEGIPQLYAVIGMIEQLPVLENDEEGEVNQSAK